MVIFELWKLVSNISFANVLFWKENCSRLFPQPSVFPCGGLGWVSSANSESSHEGLQGYDKLEVFTIKS
jgi:hypothetical protein